MVVWYRLEHANAVGMVEHYLLRRHSRLFALTKYGLAAFRIPYEKVIFERMIKFVQEVITLVAQR